MAAVPPRSDLLQLWGLVTRAYHDPELRVGRGRIIQNIFASYQQSYLQAGLAPPSLTLQDVNRLSSVAGAQYRAEQALARDLRVSQRTGLDVGLTAEYMARDIDTSPGAGFAYPGSMRVRFSIRTEVEGQPLERIVTWQPGLEGPDSVQSLQEQLEAAGSGFAEDYGEDFLGLGDFISITYV